MQYETLLVEIAGGTAVITLNRPKALNALNAKLYSELGQVTDELAANDEVKAIVITGSGDKAFAAGADIVYMAPLNSLECRKFVMSVKDILLKFENLPKPTIAALNGMALGGGCELAMCCDLRIAEEQAVFGQPEINLGIIPGAGGTQRLPRLVGAAKAKELVYLGGSINAAEAHRIGLVNMVVPTGTSLEKARQIAGKLASKGPVALAAAKAAINVGTQVDLAAGLTYEAECFSSLFATEDQKEGMKAFMEKRPAEFKGR
jgi:enoyl-CoA hydratase